MRIDWTQQTTNEGLYAKVHHRETEVIQRKLHVFGHICGMNGNRKSKSLVLILWTNITKQDGHTKSGLATLYIRARAGPQQLSYSAEDRTKWRRIIREASYCGGS